MQVVTTPTAHARGADRRRRTDVRASARSPVPDLVRRSLRACVARCAAPRPPSAGPRVGTGVPTGICTACARSKACGFAAAGICCSRVSPRRRRPARSRRGVGLARARAAAADGAPARLRLGDFRRARRAERGGELVDDRRRRTPARSTRSARRRSSPPRARRMTRRRASRCASMRWRRSGSCARSIAIEAALRDGLPAGARHHPEPADARSRDEA